MLQTPHLVRSSMLRGGDAKAPGGAVRSGNDSAPVTGDGGRELPDQGSNLEPSG